MDFYSPFWGPEAISIVIEPEGALMGRSSTLAVLAVSGPIHALFLTVLGFPGDFHAYCSRCCVYMSVLNTQSFGHF